MSGTARDEIKRLRIHGRGVSSSRLVDLRLLHLHRGKEVLGTSQKTYYSLITSRPGPNVQGIGRDVLPTYPGKGNPYISPILGGYVWVIIPKECEGFWSSAPGMYKNLVPK